MKDVACAPWLRKLGGQQRGSDIRAVGLEVSGTISGDDIQDMTRESRYLRGCR